MHCDFCDSILKSSYSILCWLVLQSIQTHSHLASCTPALTQVRCTHNSGMLHCQSTGEGGCSAGRADQMVWRQRHPTPTWAVLVTARGIQRLPYWALQHSQMHFGGSKCVRRTAAYYICIVCYYNCSPFVYYIYIYYRLAYSRLQYMQHCFCVCIELKIVYFSFIYIRINSYYVCHVFVLHCVWLNPVWTSWS